MRSATRAEPRWVTWSGSVIRRLPRGRYPLMNWVCRVPVRPFASPLRIAHAPLTFVCDLRDSIAREVCFMGHYEPQETALLRTLLQPGMSFVDVGANWGYFTLLAAERVGPRGRVAAFEPHPQLFAQLEENVERNKLTWVTSRRVAIADREGDVELTGFAEDSRNRGVSRITAGVNSGGTVYRVPAGVLAAQLDGLGIDRVDLLKIDIEGAEAFVLPTLSAGLAAARYKRILLELHPAALAEWKVDPRALIQPLLGHGYRAWRIDHSDAAARRAGYETQGADRCLQPYAPEGHVDSWPHFLFLAPGIERTW